MIKEELSKRWFPTAAKTDIEITFAKKDPLGGSTMKSSKRVTKTKTHFWNNDFI